MKRIHRFFFDDTAMIIKHRKLEKVINRVNEDLDRISDGLMFHKIITYAKMYDL